ncbi:MAG: ATP-dependent DNA helicase RecG [Clostridia bacterium]|nr:ATP-dependent DNA helicase RecG [Clostridia bacterium]
MQDNSLKDIKGLGPKKIQCLDRLNIQNLEDLVYFLPKKYNDKRFPQYISSLKEGEISFIKTIVTRTVYTGKILIVKAEDKTGKIDLVFFNSKYLASYFKSGEEYTFYGRVTRGKNKNLQMVQPDFDEASDSFPGIEPVYRLSRGLTQKDIRKFERQALEIYSKDEWLSEDIVSLNKLCDINYALKNIHFPTDEHAFKISRFRVIFEELFIFQMGLGIIKKQGLERTAGAKFKGDVSPFLSSLSFKLTPGQEKAFKEIENDLEEDTAMNRLLQGDVGSGKTIIAQLCCYKAYISGFQSAVMTPTEILAKQHYETFTKDFSSFGIKVGLLCSSMKQKEKKEVIDALEKGEIDILVGTHAIIQEGVNFKNLGLVVTDEQHRFGVKQRNSLSVKGKGANILVMTATPIPRTLAVIVYGDMDSSVIKTMPVGRLPIITQDFSSNSRRTVYSKVKEEVMKGHQAYVVAPLIEESEALDILSAEEIYEDLKGKFARVGLLHGAMKQEEKDQVMAEFVSGNIDVLVSTVVVEVGVNVPNATVMVIENCERFGLAQLHQLRGRVGRGKDQSYCYLVHKNLNEISKSRCDILCQSTDGFEIAEEDLKLRGPGDFFGTKQHGLPELKNADLINHYGLLQKIKPQVDEILKKDPDLSMHEGIRGKVMDMFGKDGQITL